MNFFPRLGRTIQLGSVFLAGLLVLVSISAQAAEIIPPAPVRYFNDFANVTKPGTAERLNQSLEQFEKDTSIQIVVAVFPKMQSDSSVEDYVNRMFRAWKIGQKQKNNGVLLAVCVQDRKMRIEVGYGLEGAIPDVIAKRIIDGEITPRFKNGDFDGGLGAGVNALMKGARGEYKGIGTTVAQAIQRQPEIGFIIALGLFFFIFAILPQLIWRRRGTAFNGRGRSSGGFWPIFMSSGGGGWSNGGGDSGGGFSGGGGDSGGGGASGSW